jgi:hypothetical protein
MKKYFQLNPSQWKVVSSAFSNISQAIILFSFAAFFVPQTVNLSENFSKTFAVLILFYGLLLMLAAVIISAKGKIDD